MKEIDLSLYLIVYHENNFEIFTCVLTKIFKK